MARLSGISKFTIVLAEAGIIYRIVEQGSDILVIVEATKGPMNGGIEGMSTVFYFDNRSGQLVCMDTWGPLSQRSVA